MDSTIRFDFFLSSNKANSVNFSRRLVTTTSSITASAFFSAKDTNSVSLDCNVKFISWASYPIRVARIRYSADLSLGRGVKNSPLPFVVVPNWEDRKSVVEGERGR